MKKLRLYRAFRLQIPDEELRQFICNSDEIFGEKGFFSEGWVSKGEFDAFPWSEFEMGIFTRHHGHGQIERATECLKAWKQIPREHQELLVAFYMLYDVAVQTDDHWETCGAKMPAGVTRWLWMELEQLAWIVVVLARREGRGQELGRLSEALERIGRARAKGKIERMSKQQRQALNDWRSDAEEANRGAHAVWADVRSRIEHLSAIRWKTGTL